MMGPSGVFFGHRGGRPSEPALSFVERPAFWQPITRPFRLSAALYKFDRSQLEVEPAGSVGAS